jgi:hypothetical protein
MEKVFSVKPEELSCVVGNLFAELEPPCDALHPVGLTLHGRTLSGNMATLLVLKDYCVFQGEEEDLEAARRPCIDRRCCHG